MHFAREMQSGAVLFILVLHGAVPACGEVDGANAQAHQKAGDKKGGGFLGRAFQEAKRLGAAIDPDAVAQAEQAWKDLEPDLRQAADDLLQAKESFQAAREETGELWSDMQRAVSGAVEGIMNPDGYPEQQGNVALEWELLKRDAAKAAKEVLGEVLGEAGNDIVSTFETRLSEALSEGNLRAASQLWRRLLDAPGVQILMRDQKLWAGAQRAVKRYLDDYMSEESAMEAERAVNATADFALYFASLRRNADKTDFEVFQELSHKLCHLQGAVEKLWPLVSRTFPLLGYETYIAGAESAIRANAVSRITLTVSASALLGLNPRKDPFLMTVIAAFSLGHITKDVAQNMAAFFQKVFMDMSEFDQRLTEQEGEPLMTPEALVTELVSGTATCEELGDQAFAFFETVKRALAEPQAPENGLPAVGAVDHPPQETSASTLPQEGRLPGELAQPRGPPRRERKLAMDGYVVKLAIWVAAVVDDPRFSLDIFFVCFGVCALLCCTFVVMLCLRLCRRRGGGDRAGVAGRSRGAHGPVSKREKTA